MATNNGQSDWNDIIEPGGSRTSGRDSLPSRRAARAGSGSHASRKAAKASSAGKKGPAKKKHRWAKRIGFSILTVFLGVFIAGMAVFLYLYNTLAVPAPDDLALAQKTTVYYADGTTEMGTLGEINRQIIDTTTLPDYVSKTIVASEDRTFYTNNGVDLKGIFRALVNNLRGGARQGGSTLTQQYVERYYIGETTSYTGKLKEAVLAIKINREKSKDEVIGAYMNTIYFGRGAYGIDAAAQAYFGHGAHELTLSESALLAAVIPAPSAWDPAVNPDKAKERWERDLNLMVEDGWITQAERDAAVFPETIDPDTLNSASMTGTNGYLMAQVKQELIASGQFDEDKISQGGLRITSTIVKEHQEQAVAAAEGMNEVEGWDPTHQHVALSSMDPTTGEILAEYAGADYEKRQQNAVTQDIAMAGSSFKPFALLANARLGGTVYDTYSGKSPQYFRGMGTPVYNDGGYSFGNVTLVKATAYSMNTVFVGLNDDVEPENTLKAAIDAGIPEDTVGLNDELLNVLGPSSPHNIDLTTAYSTIANGGERVTAHIVKKVEDSNGKLLYSGDVAPKRVFEVEEVSSIMPALEAVTKGEGTAANVDSAIARLTTAGKTGTSSDQLSAQFVGFVPGMVTAVSMYQSDDAGNSVPLDDVGGLDQFHGGDWPVDVWIDYMKPATANLPGDDFPWKVESNRKVHNNAPTPAPSATTEAPQSAAEPTETPTPTETPSTEPTENSENGGNGSNNGNNGNGNGGNGSNNGNGGNNNGGNGSNNGNGGNNNGNNNGGRRN
ncbi:MAG: transglycosylase domain-containing protein [Actinomyces sp.]|nr:penicillin-binding protein [Actinomyces sp.]MBS6638709.1 penicillin-binding protein [Actinomyces sp.]MDU7042129.1 transglycosylase domain-containing protein [Actinomyces sp.]